MSEVEAETAEIPTHETSMNMSQKDILITSHEHDESAQIEQIRVDIIGNRKDGDESPRHISLRPEQRHKSVNIGENESVHVPSFLMQDDEIDIMK